MAFSKRDVKDRVVQHPKRYRLVQVTGQADTFDLVPVPGTVIETGTPINKAYLQPIEDTLEDVTTELGNKVDKEIGKRLMTDPEGTKLAGLPVAAVNAIATGSTADPNTTQESYILTNHTNSPGGGAYWHIQTLFYSSKTGNRSQIATRYNGTTDEMYIRSCYSSTWTSWKKVFHTGNLTKADVGLGNVLNYGVATKAQAEAGTIDTAYMTPLRVKEAIKAIPTGYILDWGTLVNINKTKRVVTASTPQLLETIDLKRWFIDHAYGSGGIYRHRRGIKVHTMVFSVNKQSSSNFTLSGRMSYQIPGSAEVFLPIRSITGNTTGVQTFTETISAPVADDIIIRVYGNATMGVEGFVGVTDTNAELYI